MEKKPSNLKMWSILMAMLCVCLTVILMIMTIVIMLSVDDVMKEYEKDLKYARRGYSCVPNPCFNDANCTKTSEGFHCACLAGFTGRRCEAVSLKVPVLIQNIETKDCLQSPSSSYLKMSSDCNGTSYLWNYTKEGLLQGQESLKCLGFINAPTASTTMKHLPCNPADLQQQWACVGNEIKLKHFDSFYLIQHNNNGPPRLNENSSRYTKWINPVTSKIICE